MKSVGTFSVRKTTFVSTHVFEKWNAWEIHKFLFCANFSDPEKPLNISRRRNEIFNRSKYWPFAVNRRDWITDICTLKCDNQCFLSFNSSHQIQPEHWNEMRYQKRIFSRSFFPGFLFEYIWRCQFSLIEIYSIVRSIYVGAGKKCSGCIRFALKYHNLTRIFFHFDAKKCMFIVHIGWTVLQSQWFHFKYFSFEEGISLGERSSSLRFYEII